MNVVYKITNTVNGRVYIGSSTNGKNRITGHKNHLRKNSHPNKPLQEDYNTFGESVFEFTILKTIDNDKLSTLRIEEQNSLNEYSKLTNVYNLNFNCGAIYPNIRKYDITHKILATAFGFKTIGSFRASSAHKRYMHGIDELIGIAELNLY
jgi:group I intron endonuclease